MTNKSKISSILESSYFQLSGVAMGSASMAISLWSMHAKIWQIGVAIGACVIVGWTLGVLLARLYP